MPQSTKGMRSSSSFPDGSIPHRSLTRQQYDTSMYRREAARPIEEGSDPVNQLFAISTSERDASWNSAAGRVPCK